MDTSDIKGHLTHLRDYAITILGFDTVEAEFGIKQNGFSIQLECKDNFQKKIEYTHRVEQAFIYENFDWEKPLDIAVGEVFERLTKTMKRDERELRVGLNLIGQGLEAGADFRTHVGLEFVASMKREQEKTMLLLPDRSRREPGPVEGPTAGLDDDIQF